VTKRHSPCYRGTAANGPCGARLGRREDRRLGAASGRVGRSQCGAGRGGGANVRFRPGAGTGDRGSALPTRGSRAEREGGSRRLRDLTWETQTGPAVRARTGVYVESSEAQDPGLQPRTYHAGACDEIVAAGRPGPRPVIPRRGPPWGETCLPVTPSWWGHLSAWFPLPRDGDRCPGPAIPRGLFSRRPRSSRACPRVRGTPGVAPPRSRGAPAYTAPSFFFPVQTRWPGPVTPCSPAGDGSLCRSCSGVAGLGAGGRVFKRPCLTCAFACARLVCDHVMFGEKRVCKSF